MFSMTSLESQNSPLRTLQTFYQPVNRPHSRSLKKTFPNIAKQSQISQLYDPNHKQLSTSTPFQYQEKYLDALERSKTLQRRHKNRCELDQYISFRRQAQDDPEKSLKNSSVMSKEQSTLTLKLSNFGVSRVSSLCSILDRKQQNSFRKKWGQFVGEKKTKDQEVKDKLRFTFYNNEEKRKQVMQKYWRDQSLQVRGSNEYQNVFNRTIVQDSLMNLLGELNKKRRKGQLV